MAEKKKNALVPMNETFFLADQPTEPTLLLDTAAELNKGIVWVNELLNTVITEAYKEEVEARDGSLHKRTNFHPLTVKLLEEQRKRYDQMHHILGGEAKNDILKEMGKVTAKMIFEASRNQKSKKENFKNVVEILEDEYYED